MGQDHRSPGDLWQRYRQWRGIGSEADAMVTQDFHDDGSGKSPRYCQLNALSLLVQNILLSREPIYGIGGWAAAYVPELLGLREDQLKSLNDDRVGRALDRLFDANLPELAMAITKNDDQTHVATWDLLRELTGRSDFLYVADCKLASRENLAHIDREGARFITILLKNPLALDPFVGQADHRCCVSHQSDQQDRRRARQAACALAIAPQQDARPPSSGSRSRAAD